MRDAIPAAAMDGRGARLEEVARRLAERPAVVLQLCRREVFGGGWHSGQRYGGCCEGAAGQVPRGSSVVLERGTTGWQVAALGALAAPRRAGKAAHQALRCPCAGPVPVPYRRVRGLQARFFCGAGLLLEAPCVRREAVLIHGAVHDTLMTANA